MGIKKDLVIIGGGPAGMAAAISAYENGIKDIVVLERDNSLGGILKQCIHTGFGLEYFEKDYTGPEYALIFKEKIAELEIEYKVNTCVMELSSNKEVVAFSQEEGLLIYDAKSVILSTGCRERPMGALKVQGERPAGIITAGTAQKLINITGEHIGDNIVILGSGDIGLIMARRLTLEGKNVVSVIEASSCPGGLIRNVISCLDDFGIPLKTEKTVTEVFGRKRLEGIGVSSLDDNGNIIEGSQERIDCDTLILSVGLIPENEISKKAGIKLDPITKGPVCDNMFQTEIEGVFVCGNSQHVHELVDHVTIQANGVGAVVAKYIKGENFSINDVKLNDISINDTKERTEKAEIFNKYKNGANICVCTICPKSCLMEIGVDNTGSEVVSGNKCIRGIEYAKREKTNPYRTYTTTFKAVDGERKPLRTINQVPRSDWKDVIKKLKENGTDLTF